MIQWFKDLNASDSYLLKAFMILMIGSFGIWGIGDVITPSIDPNVAIKGGRFEVRASELQRQFQMKLERLQQNLGAEVANDPSLKRSLLENTVQELRQTSVTNTAAMAMGVDVTKDFVRDVIMEDKNFFDETGKFNQTQFNQILYDNQLSEQGYVSLVENDLRQNTMLRPVGINAAAPKYMVDKLFAYRAETRIADTLLISADQMSIGKDPSDEQIKKTYDDNIALFTAPEYRHVSAILLTTLDLVTPDSIDEAEARKFYDENAARYRTPETRKISQLLFETKEQADAVRALASPGDTLAKLAEKAKTDPPIDLGDRRLDDAVVEPLGDAAKLPLNEISQPVETGLGWHLVQTTAITPEHVTPYEAARAEIRKTLADEKGVDALVNASTKLEDEIAAGSPFSEAAATAGGRFFDFPAIDRQGIAPTGSMEINPLFEKVKQEAFYKTAFTTPVGQETQMMDVEGGYWVLKVESSTPPTPKPLEAVKDQVGKRWLEQSRLEVAKSLATNMAADLGPSVTMSSMSEKDKRLNYARLGPITRFGESLSKSYVVDSRRVSPDLLTQIFKAKEGDVFVATVQGGFVVARLKEILPAKTDGELAQTYQQLEAQARNDVAGDLLLQFGAGLAERYPLTINKEAVDGIIGSGAR